MAKHLTAGEREAVAHVLHLALGFSLKCTFTPDDEAAIGIVGALIRQIKPVGRPRTRDHDDNNPKCSCVDCRKMRKDARARKFNDAMSADLG